MDFDTYLNNAWNEHAADAEKVAHNFSTGIQLIEKNEQISAMAQLMSHVYGNHLGRWDQGVAQLQDLRKLPWFQAGTETDKTLQRLTATLNLASGGLQNVDDLSVSDQIRVNTNAAAALSEQKDISKATHFFKSALNLADRGLAKEDPANKALAITGNNLACTFEELPERTNDENELMILAAKTARRYWEIAGTSLEVGRAEYRLAMSYMKANDFENALHHAQTCVQVCENEGGIPFEIFFAYEALALVEKARGNEQGFHQAVAQVKANFEKLSVEDKSWCKDVLNKLLQ